MSIRLKLALAFASLAALVLVTTLALTYSALESAATQKVATDVKGAVQYFNNDVEQFRAWTQLQIQAVLFQGRKGNGAGSAANQNGSFVDALGPLNSRDDEFGLGGGADSADRLAELRRFHQVIASADLTELKRNALFVFTDQRGEVIFNKARPAQAGDTIPGLELLSACLAGQPGSAMWSRRFLERQSVRLVETPISEDDLLLVICEPLKQADTVVGAVMLGQTLTPHLEAFERLNQTPGERTGMPTLNLAMEGPDHVLAGSDPAILRALAQAEGRAQDKGFLLPAGGHTYAVQAMAFDPVPGSRVFLMRDVQPEIADFVHAFFGRTFFLSLFGLLLLALLFTHLLSRRLAWPLIRLEAAAREIQRGNLEVEVASLGKDEVGRLADTFNQMVQGLKQRDQIKGLFKRYLDPRVVDELIRHPEKASPGGERRVLTLLFSDLVGFTTASEKMSPEELVTLLNRYFESATRALAQHGATLDKFIGDAIMCFWNAPLPDEAHAAKACLSALALLEVVDTLREPFRAAGFADFDCRIGINTGGCVVGNLGSADAQYYTAIGDTVNLASRLEGACKVYGTRTLVSEETVLAARHAVSVRELDRVRVKGRANPVRVFELLGPAGAPVPPHVASFEEGLLLFRARKFAQARERFAAHPEDPPSRVFVRRCEEALASPPGEDWDGVHTLSSK